MMRLTSAERTARYRKRYPERIAAYKASDARKESDAKYRAEQKEARKASYTKYRATAKYARGVVRAHLRRRYGLAYEDYLRMLAEQGGVCKICLGNNPRSSQRLQLMPLFVDHCHKTNKIRGLLCNLCNNGIGAFKENRDALSRAISYLKESSNF